MPQIDTLISGIKVLVCYSIMHIYRVLNSSSEFFKLYLLVGLFFSGSRF